MIAIAAFLQQIRDNLLATPFTCMIQQHASSMSFTSTSTWCSSTKYSYFTARSKVYNTGRRLQSSFTIIIGTVCGKIMRTDFITS